MEWAEHGYNFMQSKLSDASFHSEDGITCFSYAKIDGKILLCQGGYDGIIRIFNAKTLKYVCTLKHHNAAVNKVFIEEMTHEIIPVPESPSPNSPSPALPGRKKEKVLEISKLKRMLRKVNVYSVSDDGFMAGWTIEV